MPANELEVEELLSDLVRINPLKSLLLVLKFLFQSDVGSAELIVLCLFHDTIHIQREFAVTFDRLADNIEWRNLGRLSGSTHPSRDCVPQG